MMVLAPHMLNLHYRLDDKSTEMRVLPVSKIHAYQRTRFCQFLIAESREKGKFLAVDGKIEASEKTYMDYYEKMLDHVPVKDGRALVLGSGLGVTGALLSSMGYQVDAVNSDAVLVKAVEKNLGDWIGNIETPKKITTYIYDPFDFLEYYHDQELKYDYDVVVFDVGESGIATEDCYSEDFVKKIKEVMNPGGLFVYQAGSVYDEDPALTKIIEEKFIVENKKESVSKIAEWKFSTITFKES